MSAVEQLQEAIDKLEGLKSLSHAGRWIVDPDDPLVVMRPDDRHPNGWDGTLIARTVGNPDIADANGIANAELIVTLHRTLDAQIAILRIALRFARITPNAFTDAGYDLALAVLGVTEKEKQ